VISDEHAISLIEALERKGFKIDAILPSGTHRYYSTHCRHERHDDCSATTLSGIQVTDTPLGDGGRLIARTPVLAERKPARCKTCEAPCVCPECRHP
jgi:hypothetical protein